MQTFGVGNAASAELLADLSRLNERAQPNGAVTITWKGGVPTSLLQQIDKIGLLGIDWDSYGAPAISRLAQGKACDIAFRVYHMAYALGIILPEANAFASSDGRIGLLWQSVNGERDLEILIGDSDVEAISSRGEDVAEETIGDDVTLDILTLIYKQVIRAA